MIWVLMFLNSTQFEEPIPPVTAVCDGANKAKTKAGCSPVPPRATQGRAALRAGGFNMGLCNYLQLETPGGTKCSHYHMPFRSQHVPAQTGALCVVMLFVSSGILALVC